MTKIHEDATTVRYMLDDGEHADRIVVFNKSSEEIYPEDGNRNGAFEGAARKFAAAYFKNGQVPDAVHYFS